MRRLDERFVLGRTLGAGAFGTVHEATDLETGERVALKRLTRFDATAILRFKREFRALADVSHPSVARLHELFSVGDEWCFTMELVEGLDIVSAIRGGALVGDQPRDSAVPKAPRDLARMRRLARGLASGVHALHRAGKLHRDLKPSNVIVTDAERVVLLDFGLVADTSPGRSLDESADQPIAGTPAYMSPEQGRGDATGPPSDWYSVGVILFEAMTGRVPFQGGMLEVLDRKQREDPPDPRGLVPDLPDDVASLCHRLLAREPSLRPTGAEVLAALGVSPSERTGITDHDESPWVGRASELSMLDVALSRTRKGSCVVALVHGASGMGKSALLRRFLRSATTSHAALVLESRCHDRETVPYKALDGAIDALTAALRAVRELAETMVPRDALALARVFPVLRRVDALTAPVLRPPPADPVELRRRAFLALRELLSRLADARPVVLAVDDLQWADDDSFDVLEELVRGPDPPAILVLLVAETIDETAPPKLLELRVRLEKLHEARAIELVDMHLEPFSPEEALELSRALRGPDAPEPDEIVRVAAGSPFLVQELARHAGVSAHPDDAPGAVDLRVGATTGAARRVLAWLAVAAVPLPRSLLADLASHPSATAPTAAREPAGADGLDAALEALSRAGLVVASSDTLAVELSHDRVRRAVLGSLADGALADAHRSLAAALARSGSDDHAALADHYRAIGDLARARRHAELAGDRAFAALAFDEAARRFRDALAMTTGSDATRVRRRLADALACAGRGTAAAQIYAAAAAEATDALEALTLRSLAAQQLLRAGHLDEGLARADALLEDLHVSPSGDDDVERATDALRAEIDGAGPEALAARRRIARPERLLEMEVCWSIATGLAGVDPRRGRTLHRRALRTALEVGDAPVLVRALAWESIVSALAGDAPSRARADDLAAAAEQLAQHVAEPHALAWAMSAAAVAAACEDRWQRTFDLCEYAEALFRQESADSAWEVATLGVWWRLPAVLHLGAVEDLAAMLGDLLHEADLRGDLYCATTARVHLLPQLLLLRDRPTEALDEIRLALTRWPSGWHLQHWAAAMSRCEAQLYRGETSAALEGLERAWPSMLAADQLALHHVRVRSHHVRARAAIAFASKHGNAGVHALLRESLDALAAESSPWATACASAVEAALVLPDEGPDAAAVMLDLASQRFAALDMTVLAAATRAQASRLATPSGPHAQPAHVALASLSARGVRRPEALVTALVPLLA